MIRQISIENIPLPRVSGDRYACWEDSLGVNLTMISGRWVEEIRGRVWRARYTCDVLDDEVYKPLLSTLRRGGSFVATVLTDTGETVTSKFVRESLTPATFAFEDGGRAVWHKLSFQIREEESHD